MEATLLPASEWRLKRYMPLAAPLTVIRDDSRSPKPRARMVREADRLVHGEYVADMRLGDEI